MKKEMKNGNKKVIQALNKCLINELSTIHQYVIHAKLYRDWGLERLYEWESKSSIEEMKHADELIERIIFLGEIPQVGKLNTIRIGKNILEALKYDLKYEKEGIADLKKGILLSHSEEDFGSRVLLEKILKDEEEHLDWLETNIELLDRIGIEKYEQAHIHKKD